MTADPARIVRRTATGPGLRDLLRSPSGLGGRPGGGQSTNLQREPAWRAARDGAAEPRSEQVDTLSSF